MPAKGIDVEIYYDTAPTTKVDVLNGRTSVTGLVELKGNGGGSFTIPKSDRKIRLNPQLLAYRNIVKLRVDGVVRAAFIIQTKKSVIVGQGEEAEEAWEISGEGLRSWARDAIVYPAGPLKKTAKETRYFNFASAPDSWLNPLWPNATRVRIWKGVTSNPWKTAPANWPDAPNVYWIWDRGQLPADGPAPAGKCYFRYAFIANHSSGFQKYAFFYAADNSADVYVDGELLMEAGEDTWHQTNRVDFELEPGIHVIGVEATNEGSWAGLIGALFKVGDATEPTAASLVATTGNNAFKVLSYPEDEPGWTIGNVLYKLIPEAAARGVRFAQNITMTFTEEEDSSGTPWPRGSFAFDIGTNYEDVFNALEELDCDIYLNPDTLQLSAWTVKGVDRSLQGTVENPVVLRVGHTVTEATETGQAQLTNRSLIHSKDGWFQKTASNASLEKYGTVESQFSTELSSAASAKVANDLFKAKQDPEKSNTLVYEPVSGVMPFSNFHTGDYVSAPINDTGQMERRKVVSIAFSEGVNGRPVYAVEFDKIFSDRMTLLEKGIRRAGGGGGSTGNIANGSGKPSKTPTARPTPVYNNIPDAPNWVYITSVGRWDVNGTAISDISLSWSGVSTSAGTTISDVEAYELWGRRTSDSDLHRITQVSGTLAKLKGYEAGAEWAFAVRAISRTSGPGLFSVEQNHTTVEPPEPLGPPSTPGLSTGRGTVVITWDGKIDGVNAPVHFKFMTLERRLTSGTTWKKVASFASGGTVDADVTVGTSYTYRMFATDTLNKVGAYSNTATITVSGVGMVDLDQLVKDELQAAKDAANTAQTSADGKNTIYYTTTQPTAPTGGHRTGDTWFDSDDNFKMYTWTGSAWQVTQDSAAAAALANTKARTFIQGTAPTATATGDLWIDTANSNQLKRWSGTAWVDARDGLVAAANANASAALTAANGKNKVYYQATQPTGGTYQQGDSWFDTANGNRLSVYSGSAWVLAQDSSAALAAANSKIKTFTGTQPASGMNAGDLWIDTANQNRMYRYSGSAWVDIRDGSIATAQSTANSKNQTFIQGTAPTATTAGDIWIDTANGNQLKRWSGTAWVDARDTTIADAAQAAQNAANAASLAQTSADGKNTVYYQSTTPTVPAGGHKVGDTWFNAGDGYRISRWNGSAWVGGLFGNNALASLDAGKITSGYIDAGRIAANTITGNMIAGNTVTANNMVAGTITAASGIIANAAITTAQIADLAVSNAKIADLAVTNAKISNLDAAKITTGFLNAARIEAGTITGTMIAGNTVTATNMVAGTITAASGILADAVITTAKIADAAITDAKIATLDAGKITSGFIDAGRIQVASIAANRIAIWDFTNQLPGGEFDSVEDLNNWVRGNESWNNISTTSTYSDGSAGSLYVPGNPSGGRSIAQIIPVKAGQVFKFSWSVRVGSTYNGTAQNGKIRIGDATGAPLGSTGIGNILTAWEYRDGGTGTGQYRITKTYTIPSGVTKIAVALVFDHTEGNLWLAGITMREMNAAQLIVDGEITTNLLSSQAVTADKIAAGAITADKVDAFAIDGKLITGATIRTAASGQRLQLDTFGLRAYNSSGQLVSTIYAGSGGLSLTGSLISSSGDLRADDGGVYAKTGNYGSNLRDAVIEVWGQAPYNSGYTDRLTASVALPLTGTPTNTRALGEIRFSGNNNASQVTLSFYANATTSDNKIKTSHDFEVSGRMISAHLPWAVAQGSVTLTPSAANTPTSVSVTFPSGRFNRTPRVQVSAYSSLPGTQVTGVGVGTVSSTGATLWGTRTNTTAFAIAWTATQMSETATDG